MLKKLQKASESSWHEIWNLSDRTTRRRNEVVSYRKREVTETRNQMYWGWGGGGKEPMVPFIWGLGTGVSLGSQLLAPLWIFS